MTLMPLTVATSATRNAFRSATVTHFLLIVVAAGFLRLVTAVDAFQQQAPKQHQQIQTPPLDAHNFLVGIARIGAQHAAASTQCAHELQILLAAIDSKQLWSLKVLDSFGAAPHSFLWGNYFWFSAPVFCKDLNSPYSISFSNAHAQHDFNVTSPFPLDFMVIYLDFKSPHYIDLNLPFEYFLHLGLCLPRSCDIAEIFNYTGLYFRDGGFETQRNFQLQLQPFDMRRPHFSWKFFSRIGSIFYICISLTFISLAIVAEIVFKSRTCLQAQKDRLTKSHALTTETEMTTSTLKSENPALIERILMCFRLSENYRRAINLDRKTQPSHSFLSAIAGLRTIICLWVTVFHVYYYSLYAISNAPMIFAKLEQFALQPIMQACFYVDIFFVMSAFLLVYSFLQNDSQRKQIRRNRFTQNLKLFGNAILHRYLRLTPVMVITMLLSDMVYDFLNMFTPFRLGENSGIYCKRNWWYNLLYIHNLLDMQKICCSWTWYLACEMQYFLLFTALLYAYAKRPKVTKAAFIALAIGLVVISWLCNYRNGITFQIDVIHNTLNQLYVKPWVRINPYIGGAITGWLLHQLQKRPYLPQHHQQQQQHEHCERQQRNCGKNISTSSAVVAIELRLPQRIGLPFFWFACFALYVVTNFMSYWRSTPAWLVAAIMSFGKLFFALLIGGVIVLCALGHGGPLQKLLSIRLLQFLNRFCFSIYMLAPVIVVAVFGLRREATNFTEVGSGMEFLAVIALSIASAFLLVLLVELPIQRISSLFLRGGSSVGCSNGRHARNGGHVDPNIKITNGVQ